VGLPFWFVPEAIFAQKVDVETQRIMCELAIKNSMLIRIPGTRLDSVFGAME
jgi:hypothetical protein